LRHIGTGVVWATGVGSCATTESKYRYRYEYPNGHKTRVENKDIADVYNTCLKMAKKRAQIDATLTALSCSHLFTQDLEDYKILNDDDVKSSPSPSPHPQAQAAQEAEVVLSTAPETAKPDYFVNINGDPPANPKPAPKADRVINSAEQKELHDFIISLKDSERVTEVVKKFCKPKYIYELGRSQACKLVTGLIIEFGMTYNPTSLKEEF